MSLSEAWAIDATQGARLFAPHSYPFEIGNALSALVKRMRLSAAGMLAAWEASQRVSVSLRDVDIPTALSIAAANNL